MNRETDDRHIEMKIRSYNMLFFFMEKETNESICFDLVESTINI